MLVGSSRPLRITKLILIVGGLVVVGVPSSLGATLSGSATGTSSVELRWTPYCTDPDIFNLPAQCGTTQVQSYAIYVKNTSYQNSWEPVDAITNIQNTDYTVIGLTPGTVYQFKVVETGNCWSGWFSSGCSLLLESNIITVETRQLPALGLPDAPGQGFWTFVPALLSLIVAGITAGILLAFRVQLSEWYRHRQERKAGHRS